MFVDVWIIFYFSVFFFRFLFFLDVIFLTVISYGMDDQQISHMSNIAGIQLSDGFDLDTIEMYTSSFN